MAELRSFPENPVVGIPSERIVPYCGPKPTVEHELILLDAKHRNGNVMFSKENKTAANG